MRKIICAVIAIACVFWIIGIAGQADLYDLSLGSIVAQGSIAVGLLYVSAWIGGLSK